MDAVEEADRDCAVWINSVLGPDARDRRVRHDQPVHLEQPDPDQGLTEDHVAAVAAIVRRRGPAGRLLALAAGFLGSVHNLAA